jgi:hypothetical protein
MTDWLDEQVTEFLATKGGRYRLRTNTRRDRLPFLRLTLQGLAKLSQARLSQPAVILHLEMIRLSGLKTVQSHGGWVPWDRAGFKRLGLHEKNVRYRAVKLLVAAAFIETRGACTAGRKLEYRLNPDWVTAEPGSRPRPKVVDLAAVRKARKQKS